MKNIQKIQSSLEKQIRIFFPEMFIKSPKMSNNRYLWLNFLKYP